MFSGEDAKVLWQLIGAVATIFGLLNGLFFWAFRWVLNRQAEHIVERIAAIEKTYESGAQAMKALERDILELRAELPEKYVRREDWIRFGATIDTKLDGLREAVERIKKGGQS